MTVTKAIRSRTECIVWASRFKGSRITETSVSPETVAVSHGSSCGTLSHRIVGTVL